MAILDAYVYSGVVRYLKSFYTLRNVWSFISQVTSENVLFIAIGKCVVYSHLIKLSHWTQYDVRCSNSIDQWWAPIYISYKILISEWTRTLGRERIHSFPCPHFLALFTITQFKNLIFFSSISRNK